MSDGWIRVWRQAFENEFLDEKPYNSLAAWVYLLSRVQHKQTAVRFAGKIHSLERGQLVTSVRHLAKQFGWSKQKVGRWLNHLEALKMSTQNGTPDGTLITVLKWDDYQPLGNSTKTGGTASGTQTRTPTRTAQGQQRDTSNNTELQNTENNTPLPPSRGGRGTGRVSKREAQRLENKRVAEAAIEAARKWEEHKKQKGGGT